MISKYTWNKVEDVLPEDKVVLAACNTYDCGWVMDTVWWNVRTKRWMVTGTIDTQEAHLPYTHWRELPQDPDEEQRWFDKVNDRDYFLGPRNNTPAPVLDTLADKDNMNSQITVAVCILTAILIYFVMV